MFYDTVRGRQAQLLDSQFCLTRVKAIICHALKIHPMVFRLFIICKCFSHVHVYVCLHAANLRYYVFDIFIHFHAAAGYEHVETPVSFGPRMSSTPVVHVPHSHTSPLHYMTPSVCCCETLWLTSVHTKYCQIMDSCD